MDACYNAPRTKLLTIVGPVGTRLRVIDTLGCLYPGAPAKVENLLLRFMRPIANRWRSARSASCRDPGGPSERLDVLRAPPQRRRSRRRLLRRHGVKTSALGGIARDADLFICSAPATTRRSRRTCTTAS